MFSNSSQVIDTPQGYGGYTMPNTTAWQQGLVIRNMFFDYETYEMMFNYSRCQSENNYVLFYDAPINPDVSSIHQGDPVFRLKDEYASNYSDDGNLMSGTIGDNGARKILGCLNGIGFCENDEKLKKMLANNPISDHTFRRHIRSKIDFCGFAQTHFMFNKDGMREFTKSTSMPAVYQGEDTIFNTGNKNIRPFKDIVYDVPSRHELKSYPPRLNNFLDGRDPNTILLSLKEYDPKEEFNFELLYRSHILKFNVCAGYNFKKASDYLPKNFDEFEYNFTFEKYCESLFCSKFVDNLIVEAANYKVFRNDSYHEWDGPLVGERISKLLLETQKLLIYAINDSYPTDNDKIMVQRALRMSLIQLETGIFGNFTDIYRAGKAKENETYILKSYLTGCPEHMYRVQYQAWEELNSRIIGKSLTGAPPGKAFDMFIRL